MNAIDTINQMTQVVDALQGLLSHMGILLASVSTTCSAVSAIVPNSAMHPTISKIVSTAALNVGNAKNASLDS